MIEVRTFSIKLLWNLKTHHTVLLALLGALLQVEVGNVLGVVGAWRNGAHALVVLAAHVALEAVGETETAAAQDNSNQDSHGYGCGASP